MREQIALAIFNDEMHSLQIDARPQYQDQEEEFLYEMHMQASRSLDQAPPRIEDHPSHRARMSTNWKEGARLARARRRGVPP